MSAVLRWYIDDYYCSYLMHCIALQWTITPNALSIRSLALTRTSSDRSTRLNHARKNAMIIYFRLSFSLSLHWVKPDRFVRWWKTVIRATNERVKSRKKTLPCFPFDQTAFESIQMQPFTSLLEIIERVRKKAGSQMLEQMSKTTTPFDLPTEEIDGRERDWDSERKKRCRRK